MSRKAKTKGVLHNHLASGAVVATEWAEQRRPGFGFAVRWSDQAGGQSGVLPGRFDWISANQFVRRLNDKQNGRAYQVVVPQREKA